MDVFYTPFFKKRLKDCPEETKRKFYRQAAHLLKSIRHPSLRAKKYDEARDIWQARVDRNYRFYFSIRGNTYILLDIRTHPK